MILGRRLREIRELMSLSQGDIEKTSGLLRCYVSRVENGHTIPSLETLEKWAHALSIPLYRIFYDGEEPPKPLGAPRSDGCFVGQVRTRSLGIRAASALPEAYGSQRATDSAIVRCSVG